jgi:hypothetical protein
MMFNRWIVRVAACAVAIAALFAVRGERALGDQLWNGLVSYWTLNGNANDTGPAGTVADNGTVRNSPTWISGKFNAGLQFDGLSQDVVIANSSDMAINTEGVTISAWVKLDTLPSGSSADFASIYDSERDNYVLYLDRVRKELRFKATNANGVSTNSDQHPGVPEAMLDTSQWHHVMGVFDGVAGQSRIYMDGQLFDRSSQSNNGGQLKGFVRPDQIAGIGAQPAVADLTPSNFFQGAVSDLAVWNRSLGLAEAQYLYNNGTGNAVGANNANIIPIPTTVTPVLPSAQPVIYYKFNGNLANSGTGGSALDAVATSDGRAAPLPFPVSYATTSFGSGLDLSANPVNADGVNGIDASAATGVYAKVGYTLPNNGTIAVNFTATSPLYNWLSLWGNSSHNNDWEAWIYGDGRIAARADRNTPFLGQSIYDLDAPGIENHIAFTWTRNGSEMVMKMYVDGKFVDERVGPWRDPGDTFSIGGSRNALPSNGSNRYGRGVYDEFRIYSTALTEAEILYLSQNAPETINLLAADFNSDLSVNSADLSNWKLGFGMTTGAQRVNGDADQDGDVDGADVLVWQRQLGSMTTVAVNAGAAPEPAAAMLACLAGVGLWTNCRRRRVR